MFCCNSFYSSRSSSFSSKKWCPAEGWRFHGDSLQWHPGPIQAVLWFRETATVPTKVNRSADISNGHRHAKTSYWEVTLIKLYVIVFSRSCVVFVFSVKFSFLEISSSSGHELKVMNNNNLYRLIQKKYFCQWHWWHCNCWYVLL